MRARRAGPGRAGPQPDADTHRRVTPCGPPARRRYDTVFTVFAEFTASTKNRDDNILNRTSEQSADAYKLVNIQRVATRGFFAVELSGGSGLLLG